MRRRVTSPDGAVRGRRVLAAGAVAIVGSAAFLLGATADAKTPASSPTPHYTAGKDTATFTVTGVLDRNCLVSVGGNKIYIKPGDAIDFASSLAGVDTTSLLSSVNSTLGGLLGGTLTGGSLAGLDVTAVLDANTPHQKTFSVTGGKTTTIKGLSSGTHTLSWTATSVALVPGALSNRASVPLSSGELKSGAKLSWSGHVYVTKGAPDCKLAVSTPTVHVSAGPVHASVPGVNVTAPVDPNKVVSKLPKVPSIAPITHGSSSAKAKAPAKKAPAKKAPAAKTPTLSEGGGLLPVPARVVPIGFGSGGTSGTQSTGSGSGNYALASGGGSGYAKLSVGSVAKSGTTGSSTAPAAGSSDTVPKTAADLADTGTPSTQLPIVLAIIAIVALSLVGAAYARLFLLRRQN